MIIQRVLIGHGGNHGKLFSCATHGHRHRGFARGGKASAAHIGIDQRRFISPMDFGAFLPGALLNPWIFAFEPPLHSLWVLFVGALDRLLRSEAPACKVFVHTANVQLASCRIPVR